MAKMTVVLNGSGGELDRFTFTLPKRENLTSDDLAEAIRKYNKTSWILGEGDTIVLSEAH